MTVFNFKDACTTVGYIIIESFIDGYTGDAVKVHY